MAMSQHPTVFIVGRKKNEKKEPTISKAEMDERVAKVETIMRNRNKQDQSKHNIQHVKPPPEQLSAFFNLYGDKNYALHFSLSGLNYDYWKI